MIFENECHFILRQAFQINKITYILKVPAFSH